VIQLVIGLVSISDRASTGVYEDKGIPALQEWLASALTTPVAGRNAADCRRPADHRKYAD
jgi:molybdopterin biosynthesis enzyme MoaB